MEAPDKCPGCGSPYQERWGERDRFWCGSFIRVYDGRFRDSEDCVRLQLEAACAELDRLRQQYESLRAAINRVADTLYDISSSDHIRADNEGDQSARHRADAYETAQPMVLPERGR